ncbi:MAG: hypothetical protein ACI4WR_00635 [Bulleidia sp.]
MFRRFLALAAATGAAIAVTAAVKTVTKKKDSAPEEEDDDSVNFIEIDSDDESSEKPEEAPADQKEKEYAPEVKEISELYPYLSMDYIEEQLRRNDAFNEEYPEDTLVTISHKAEFGTDDGRSQFRTIAEQNGYEVKDLGEKECLAVHKMFTQNGAILSDIFNVANQVGCLKGSYEGYKIEA